MRTREAKELGRCVAALVQTGQITQAYDLLAPVLKQAFEPRSPGVKRRLQAMEKLADAGILAGTSLMPVIPFVGDDEGHWRTWCAPPGITADRVC